MQCINGHENNEISKFCTSCGSVLVSLTQSGENPETQALASNKAQQNTKRNLLIAGAIAVLILVGLNISSNQVQYTNVKFTLTVYSDSGCDLSWGYWNVPGMETRLYADGKLVGTESLPSYGDDGYFYCDFEVTFNHIPMNANTYKIKSDRGVVSYSKSSLVKDKWKITASLG